MKPEYRISNAQAFFLISTAVLVDGLQFLLDLTVVGSLISMALGFVAFIVFGFWFFFLKVNYLGRNAAVKMLYSLGAVVIEIIPLLDALPGITLAVVGLIVQTRMEDAKAAGKEFDPRKALQLTRIAAAKANRSAAIQAARVAQQAKNMRLSQEPDA